MMDRSWSPSVLQALAASIRDHAGLSFVPSRYDELERCTRRAMAKVGASDVGDYTDGLGSGRFSFEDWVAELTVGETYFFREPLHFEFLRRRVLPGIQSLRGASHVFRVWSAGCASGEEAYSLAILFEEQLLGANLRLIATDISRAALARARAGRYGAWSLRGSDDERIDRYFRRREKNQFEIIDRIRRQVTFEYLNLARGEYPSFFTGVWGNDIILCRNVMIYLDRDTVRGLARRLFESLADGGWLITGPSDPPLGELAPYETMLTDAGVFYRRPERPSLLAGPGASHRCAEVLRRDDVPPSEKVEVDTGPYRGAVSTTAAGDDPVELARRALAAGLYDRAIQLARLRADDSAAAALEVRATANLLGTAKASRLCAAAVLRFPLAVELYVLQASLLLDLRDYDAAAQTGRRLLYLDRSLVVAHLLLGSIHGKRGERDEALRAFRNARELAGSAPSDDLVPFTDGERAGRLADFARAQIEQLGAEPTREQEGAQ